MAKDKLDKIMAMLKSGVEEVFSSGRYAEWLRVCGMFHDYSVNNQILILMQAPNATRVAGYRTWQRMGRQVKKGERGIAIVSPVCFKEETDDGEERVRTLFKTSAVFDISQTEGDELPGLAEELAGDGEEYAELRDGLVRCSTVPVVFSDDTDGAYGYYSPRKNVIVVKESVSRQQQCKTLIHEIAHSICDAAPAPKEDRETKEVRAESVAFCVCSALGFDTSQYSFGYIASWSSGKEISELKAVMREIKTTSDDILSRLAEGRKQSSEILF